MSLCVRITDEMDGIWQTISVWWGSSTLAYACRAGLCACAACMGLNNNKATVGLQPISLMGAVNC